jgi:hypothetical protein
MDLWPKFDETSRVRSPVIIMKEQAALLGKKTNNIVKGFVLSSSPARTGFTHDFYLLADELDGYRYKLFSIFHDIDLYPVQFEVGMDLANELRHRYIIEESRMGEEIKYSVENEKDFISFLGSIFSSKRTIKIVNVLLSQAKAGDWFFS